MSIVCPSPFHHHHHNDDDDNIQRFEFEFESVSALLIRIKLAVCTPIDLIQIAITIGIHSMHTFTLISICNPHVCLCSYCSAIQCMGTVLSVYVCVCVCVCVCVTRPTQMIVLSVVRVLLIVSKKMLSCCDRFNQIEFDRPIQWQ